MKVILSLVIVLAVSSSAAAQERSTQLSCTISGHQANITNGTTLDRVLPERVVNVTVSSDHTDSSSLSIAVDEIGSEYHLRLATDTATQNLSDASKYHLAVERPGTDVIKRSGEEIIIDLEKYSIKANIFAELSNDSLIKINYNGICRNIE